MKADPTRIQFSKLSSTNYDDLARAIRHKLKKLKINYDLLPVVYSNE